MVNAATEFVKAGYSEDDAATLGYIASMYSNVADEEVAVGEAANFMIAQMAAFNIEAEDSMHIIDAVYLRLAVWRGELTGTALEPCTQNYYSNIIMAWSN